MRFTNGLRWFRDFAWLELFGRASLARQRDGRRAAILMYHRVLPRAAATRLAVEDGMFVTPETFAHQVEYLARKFTVLSLGEVSRRISRGDALPSRTCAISFDDGWKDNLDFAFSILRRFDLPATIFIVTERVGTRGAFWPDEVCRRLAPLPRRTARALVRNLGIEAHGDPARELLEALKSMEMAARARLLEQLRTCTESYEDNERELLNWDELGELQRAGIDIESHAATHAILTDLDEGQLSRELTSSRTTLHAHGMGRQDLLAYPAGAFDPAVRSAAIAAGYRGAVSTELGWASIRSDPHCLPRIAVHEDISSTRISFLYRLARCA